MGDEKQHWLYPINFKAGYVLGSDEERETELVTRENLWSGILSPRNAGAVDDWHLSAGFKSMMPGDLIWIVDTAPPKAIVAVGEAIEVYKKPSGSWSVDLMWLQHLVSRLKDDPIPKGSYGQTAQTVNRANSRTSRFLDDWLAGGSSATKRRTKDMIPEHRRRVLREIAQRRGQAAFRAELMAIYNERCAITGSRCIEVLEAAHIVPYADGGSTGWRNGILLRSDIHTLFDLHLITIDETGKVRVSPRLTSEDYRQYHGMMAKLPSNPKHRPTKAALRAHASITLKGATRSEST
jgi:hypothetical protein